MSRYSHLTEFNTKPTPMPKPACNLSKRVMKLAAMGDGIHTLQLVIIRNEWRVSVNGLPMEYLGEVDSE